MLVLHVYAPIQVVKKEYSSFGQLHFSFILGFEKDSISLNIPEKGLELNGWKITPFYNPKVSSYCINCEVEDDHCKMANEMVKDSAIMSDSTNFVADYKAAGPLLQFWKKNPQM